MTALVSAEVLKLRTTRAWIGVLLAVASFSGLGAAATVGSAPDADLGSVDLSRDVLSAATFAGFLAFLWGITVVTSEWRHGTITRTFLLTPRRARVLFAKGAAGLVIGVTLAVVALLVVLAVAVTWLAIEGSTFALDRDVVEVVVRIAASAALWGAIGVGVGAVLQSQTPALIVGIVWVLVLEPLLEPLLGLVDLGRVASFLPAHALASLEGEASSSSTDAADALGPWAGGLVALGWIVLLGLLGALRMARRDVT